MWSGHLDKVDVDPTPVIDDPPDPISHETVSVTTGVDALGRAVLQVRLAPSAIRDLHAAGGQIVVQVVPDENLA